MPNHFCPLHDVAMGDDTLRVASGRVGEFRNDEAVHDMVEDVELR